MKRRACAALVAIFFGPACGSPAPPPNVVPASIPATPVATASATTTASTPTLRTCQDADVSIVLRQTMEALGKRDTTSADDILIARLAATPTDLAAETALNAVRDLVEEMRAEMMERLANDAPTVLDPARTAPHRTRAPDPPPTIAIATDLGAGGAYHAMDADRIEADEMRRYHALPPDLPAEPLRGQYTHQSFADQDVFTRNDGARTLIVFGATRARSRAFVFSALVVRAARLVGDVVVVSLEPPSAHVPDLYAFEASSGALLWSAEGAGTSAIASDYVLSRAAAGVVARDIASGEIVQTLATGEAPRALHMQGDRIYAYGTRRDLALSITPNKPRHAPDLSSLDDTAFLTADARCKFGAAFDAVGARDLTRLDALLADLRRTEKDGALLRHLTKARERLNGWKSGSNVDRIDLLAVAPTVLAAPPWQRTPTVGASTSTAKPTRVTLTQKSSIAFRSWDGPEPTTVAPDQPVFIAPAQQGHLLPGARTDIPPFFGVSSLSVLVPIGADAVLLYGERWLAIVRGQRTEKLFDLDAYRHPPITKPKDAFPGAPTYVSFASMRGDTLYLCNGGGSYAEMARGKKGYITAIDARSSTVIWQSDALVCDSPFVFWRDYLVTGYGFTSEPDFLRIVRLSDGAVVAKAPVDTAPAELFLAGDRVTVNTYERRFEFDLAER